MSDPWMKFYPSDWRSDPKLRLVSMAARGLWMEMLCLMHEADNYGDLCVAGVTLDETKLSRMVGESAEAVTGWLSELREADVFSTRKNGVIYSRRMEKDENKRRKARENGKKGGNPNLSKQTEKDQPVKGGDKTQKPEARDQKEREAKASSPKPRGKRNSYPDDFEGFWKAYPNTANNSKPKAGEQWAKLDADDREAAMRSLPVYRAHLAKTEQTCKHAERYLRDRRFETLQPASATVISLAPIDLPNTPEGKFLADCRANGAGETAVRRWNGQFLIRSVTGRPAFVVDGDEVEFAKTFAGPIEKSGREVLNRLRAQRLKERAQA